METVGTHRQALAAARSGRPLSVTGMSTGLTSDPLPPTPAEPPAPAVEAVGYLRYLRVVVNAVDAAMAAEGIEPDVRDRVVARVMGTPEPG